MALPLAPIPLAPALFMGYQWWVSGDFFLTIRAQRKFTRAPMPPWDAVFHGFRRFDPLWFREGACLASGGQIGPRACVAELRRAAIPHDQALMPIVFLLLVPLLRRAQPGRSSLPSLLSTDCGLRAGRARKRTRGHGDRQCGDRWQRE